MSYKLKPLGVNQPSYTIKQMTTLLNIGRGKLNKLVREGRFVGINSIEGKLTGIKDDTVYINDVGEKCLIGDLVKGYIESQ